MKHIWKRLTVLLLIAGILCAYLVPGVSAADSKEDAQQAIIETAMAYYYKGIKAQYDNIKLTAQPTLLRDKLYGELRTTDGEPPEWASDDHTLYMVCAGLVYNTILHSFGYKLTGSGRTCLTINLSNEIDPKTPGVIFHTGGKYGEKFDEQAARDTINLLEPGDIICYCNLSDGTGHTGIYVGDVLRDGTNYFVNSGGSKLTRTTGIDIIEDATRTNTYGGGTVRLDPVTSASTGYGATSMTGWHSFTVIRPTIIFENKGLSLTEEAKTRLKYKGIDVDRTISAKQYDTVTAGDEITVTVTVTNHGKSNFKDVEFSEPLPVGAEVIASSIQGGEIQDGAITGKLNVPFGKSAKLEYKVKVTGARGGDVTFPSGTVAGALTTRPTSVRIGGKDWNSTNLEISEDFLLAKNIRKIQSLPHSTGLDFVNSFYREFFGLDLGMPATVAELQDTLLKWSGSPITGITSFNGQMLIPKKESELTEQGKHLREMILPEHLAGYWVYLRDDLTAIPEEDGAQGRVMGFDAKHYQIGDIFVGYGLKSVDDPSVDAPEVYVYLGNGMAAGVKGGAGDVVLEPFGATLGKFMRHDVMAVFRPRLAYDDVNLLTNNPVARISFPDVKESDWFYSYVTDLAKDGIVGGMSDGTFQPNGTLTYGQALKLLICALDKDVGNAASGHWASNYLSAAQSKGWISGSVNLDAGISRLSFCQIAAKAKGLTEQPASNPFTDTSDASVLALNKAGVIGGMGEGIFSPDTTLTRAQISKIIVELRKV